MQMITGALGQPTMDQGGLVNGRIVQYQMDVQLGWEILIDGIEELTEFDTAVPVMALGDHRPSCHVQGGEEVGRAVPEIVVGVTFNLSGAHRQHWGGGLPGLDLRLLVDAQDQGSIRWGQIEPDDVLHLLHEQRIMRQLERLGAVRLEGEGPPDPATAVWLGPRPGRASGYSSVSRCSASFPGSA